MLDRLRFQLIAYYIGLLKWVLFHTTGRYVAWRLRREGRVDVFLGQYDDRSMIFWPCSKKGKKVLNALLAHFPKQYGGYTIPERQWTDVYDLVHMGDWTVDGLNCDSLVIRAPQASS